MILSHDRLVELNLQVEESPLALLALQAPVAGDLHGVVGSLQGAADAEPMGCLALHVAKVARRRYPAGIPDKVRQLIEHELVLIAELRYEAYFLTVWDIVRFARQRDILCQGRGSAANSAVCFCLGITSVDPDHIDVLFERFVSRERNEPLHCLSGE